MPIEPRDGPLNELRGVTASLTTTAQVVALPPGTARASIEGRTFATAVVVQLLLNPWLVVLKTADLLVSATDYSDAAQDASAATDVVLSSLDTFANGDALYIGSHLPILGVAVDVDAANGTASVLSGDYWDGDSWEALSITDGSTSGGATFAQDGNITWTLPADWAPSKLRDAVATCTDAVPQSRVPLYWLRLKVSAALDSSTTLNSLLPINRSTAYAELPAGRDLTVMIDRAAGGLASIQAKTDAGTATLIANVVASGPRGFS